MITANYRFADKIIEVNSIYDSVHEYCSAYRTDAPADLAVTITQDDIEYERSRAESGNWSDKYLEELAVYRKICEKMPYYDTILFHGSVIAVDGYAYMFTATSGTGKSTHAALWRKLLGERAVMVNDDKPLLHIGETTTAYGTPYDGKHRLSSDISVPVKAVCILERSSENHIETISKSDAYPMLLQQVYRPNDVFALRKTLTLLDKMACNVSFFRLGCNMDISAAELSYGFMSR